MLHPVFFREGLKMLIGYDFEVYKYNWLVVFVDPFEKTVTKIWDDPFLLKQFYENRKDYIFVGYNNRFYDQFIFKGILCGFDPYEINTWIIKKGLPGYKFSDLFRKINMINYDTQPGRDKSLKQLEAYQGHNIFETSVDFNHDAPLTDAEKRETEKYCINDVMETLKVFSETKDDFDAQLALIKMFDLPLTALSKTKAQIVADDILECTRCNRSDTWELYTLPCLQLEKYQFCKSWFFDKNNQWYEKHGKENPGFTAEIAGVPHSLGFGGIHGARSKYNYICKDGYMLIHVDVESYYPSLMVEYDLITRNARKPERFNEVKEKRLALKRAGKKKEQAPLKIVINGTYGISNDSKSSAYDPRNANLITMNGQLLLIDLIEKLEVVHSFELIQSNTDGLIIKIHDRDFELVDDICYEWETRTKMKLAFDTIDIIYQGDVNNYMFRFAETGKWERKGAYVKELSTLDYDVPIVNKAIVDYLTTGITPTETINNCDDLMQFQKVVKLSGKYTDVEYNGKLMKQKCYRVFASNNWWDKTLYRVKENGRKDKFPDISEHCFIDNGDVRNKPLPDKLNKNYYINLAETRLFNKFGIRV